MTVIPEGFERQLTMQQLYDAGIIPPFLDRSIKPDGTKMTWDEIMSHLATLRSHERKSTKIKMPTKREIAKGTKLGMSLAELKATVLPAKGA